MILESWKIISECHGPDSWLLKTWPFPKYKKNMHSLFLHTMSTIIQFLTQRDQTKFFICCLKKKDWLSEHQNSFPNVFILVVESGKYFLQTLIYLKITAKYIILLVVQIFLKVENHQRSNKLWKKVNEIEEITKKKIKDDQHNYFVG